MQAHSALFIEACSCSPERRRLTGLENIGPERTLSGPLGNAPVNSPTRITLENNEKIRPEPDVENAFTSASGGGNGTAVEPSLGAKILSGNKFKAGSSLLYA